MDAKSLYTYFDLFLRVTLGLELPNGWKAQGGENELLQLPRENK